VKFVYLRTPYIHSKATLPMEEVQQPATKSRPRFVFIDALRGLASMSVVLFHLSGYVLFRSPAGDVVPGWLRAAIDAGSLGVYVFFSISGFVIFYAIGDQQVSPRFAGRFVARRSVRLDPPYWTAIAASLAVAWVSAKYVGTEFDSPPYDVLIAHVFYAQNLLGMPNLSVGLWTLCIEIQFYLFALFAMFAAQKAKLSKGALTAALLLAFLGSAIVFSTVDSSDPAIALNSYRSLIPNLCLFGFGVLPWLRLERSAPSWPMFVLLAATAARLVYSYESELLVSALTGIAFWLAVEMGKLDRWLAGRPLQFLGKISYSLYLIHFPVAMITKRVLHKLVGESNLAVWLTFFAAVGAAIATAALMHRLVEAPFTRLARRLFRPPPGPVSAL